MLFLHLYSWLPNLPTLLYRWQTLIAGMLALAGAWLTVRAIARQLRQADEFQRDARQRDERAAKAVLPVALSRISQYATDCIRLFEPYASAAQPSMGASTLLATPRFPEGVLGPCQVCIRFTDEQHAEQIAKVLRWLQTQHARIDLLSSRINSRHGNMVLRHEAVCAVMDAAEVHALCSGVFPYARGVDPDPTLTFQGYLRAAIEIAAPKISDLPHIRDAIERRREPHKFERPFI